MGTLKEYIEKSSELFGLIAGWFSVKDETVVRFKEEYEKLLQEVIMNESYPDGTSQDICNNPSTSGYIFGIDHSFNQSEKNTIARNFERKKIQLYDLENGNMCVKYIGNLAALKSKRRYVVLTKNETNIRAIKLMNELFYKTPPILIGKADTFLTHIDSGQIVPNTSTSSVLPTAGWDSLD